MLKNNLQEIPGVGNSISKDLCDLGIKTVSDLKGRNPQALFDELGKLRKAGIDRCVLYVFRCAVYYAENKRHDPELLKWWNWKNRERH